MATISIETEPIVFCVDQRPFPSGDNTFCVLCPLMTLSGKEFTDLGNDFPDRGRVWWLVRENISKESVVPASLWVGRVEPAGQYRSDPRYKDYYQALRDIQKAGRNLIEIIDLGSSNPHISLVREKILLPFARPTTPSIFVCGPDLVMGPLKALSPQPDQLLVEAQDDKGEVLELSRSDFDRLVRKKSFHHEVNEFDPKEATFHVQLRITRPDWFSFKELRAKARVLDGSTDEQIILNAAMLAGHKRRSRDLADIWSKVKALEPFASPERNERLKQLSKRMDYVLSMGEDVLQTLAESQVFTELISQKVREIAQADIEKEVKERQGEIEAQVQARKRTSDNLQNEISKLQDDFDRKSKEQKSTLEEERREYLDGLTQRESAVSERERAIECKESEVERRLERVLSRYKEASEKIGDDLLVQIPILSRFFKSMKPETTILPERVREEPKRLQMGAFVERVRERNGSALSEVDFILQFTSVCERRGYIFDRDDLINFHVCVKTGMLTVLAGRSGTGKSSLPRLYAEALGCNDEFLSIPVRPDWLDDRDLLGAFNPLSSRYEPANTGLVDQLIAAHMDESTGRGGIYLICFDEMNLARVEHYFAQFISILEKWEEDRKISLCARGLAMENSVYGQYRELPIGKNVRFVGTVNIDQTTHFFSPKVLDRSQIVSFTAADLSLGRQKGSVKALAGLSPVHFEEWLSWLSRADGSESIKKTILQINDALKRSRLGLGYRACDRMLLYIANARPFFPEEKALDFQLLQVVLPTLRQTAPGFRELIDSLGSIISAERFPRSASMLNMIAEAEVEDEFFQLL